MIYYIFEILQVLQVLFVASLKFMGDALLDIGENMHFDGSSIATLCGYMRKSESGDIARISYVLQNAAKRNITKILRTIFDLNFIWFLSQMKKIEFNYFVCRHLDLILHPPPLPPSILDGGSCNNPWSPSL